MKTEEEPRKYCVDCSKKLEADRRQAGLEQCRSCVPGWPQDDRPALFFSHSEKTPIVETDEQTGAEYLNPERD